MSLYYRELNVIQQTLSIPRVFTGVTGSLIKMAASNMVITGDRVTTSEASMGEVLDNPTIKDAWLMTMAKTAEEKKRRISFLGTNSLLIKSDAIQNRTAAPNIRRNVIKNGSTMPGVMVRAMGIFKPKTRLDVNNAK